MAHPSDRKYSKEHEWVLVDGDVATIGISDFAQDQLGEVVYVDLPGEGDDARRRRLVRRDRVGQVGLRAVRPGLRRDRRGQRIAGRHARDRQRRRPTAPAGWSRSQVDDASELDALLSAEEYDAFITEG